MKTSELDQKFGELHGKIEDTLIKLSTLQNELRETLNELDKLWYELTKDRGEKK